MSGISLLLQRAKSGDREAAERLFELLQARALEMARARLGPGLRRELDSVDVQQSVLKDAYKDLAQCHGSTEPELLAWLAALVENKLRNKARNFGAAKRDAGQVARLDASAEGSVPLLEPTDDATSPGDKLLRREQSERLQRALAALPDEWRRAFELRTSEGLAWADVAARMGKTESAVRGYHARAAARIQRELGEA
jgi:RNA polymerase sigma-70 factor (ECF subfamily)